MADRFMIAPYDKDSGLRTNFKPFLIPDQAFSVLENAYVFRGRVRKRFGSLWLDDDMKKTRLRLIATTTDGLGNATFDVTSIGVIPAVGQMFSIGDYLYTVYRLSHPTDNILVDGVGVATFTPAGVFTVTGTGLLLTDVYFYPALPVMGLMQQEVASVNNEPTIAFDTRFAYKYNNGWQRLTGGGAAATWTGDDSQFFYGTNWIGNDPGDRTLFVTNFNELETQYMRYFTNNTWTSYRPKLSDIGNSNETSYLNSARILIPFHNHLLAFNTWEEVTAVTVPPPALGLTNYQSRVRWSWAFSPFNVDAWRTDIDGKGGGLDAATTEAIIGAVFVQDRLIVYFENSTWELVWTSNQVQPFIWQQINTGLGAESTFSVIPFDRVAIGIGNVGVHSCNGISVDRIDLDIPQISTSINNTFAGPERVQGIRDFTTEVLYWAYPDQTRNATNPYPNKVLVFNYRNNTWAINDDSITALGYFQASLGITWDSTQVTWNSDTSWDGQDAAPLYRNILAGNQQGFTFLITADQSPTLSPNLSIANVTFDAQTITITSIKHGLEMDDYIFVTKADGLNNFNNLVYQIESVTDDTMTVSQPNPVITGTYTGGGVIARVPVINISTKQYNFYLEQGLNAAIDKVDFMLDKTGTQDEPGGAFSVQIYTSTSGQNNMESGAVLGSLPGDATISTSAYDLYPYEASSERVLRSFYPMAEGETIQLVLTMSDEQLKNINVMKSDFQMHYMIFSAQPTSRLQ